MTKKKKRALTGVAVLLVLLALPVLAGACLLNAKTSNPETVRIDLPEGSGYSALCDSLYAHSVLRPGTAAAAGFGLTARTLGLHKRVRPGSYRVGSGMKLLALTRKLRNGQQDPIRLTIGKFRLPQQLNEYLNSKLMHDDFNVTLDSFHLVLPDTYEFYWTVTPEAFMQRMEREYARTGYTRETVILASIVEEETNYGPEKPLIASVYLNRLKRGMPLQADPTVKYAVGDFTLRRILNKHLAVESPFNTYLHTGLPPAPICLPSKASIEAVLNAPTTNYLYFCASERLDGTHRFAVTLAEHTRNAALYHAAISKKQ